MQYKVLKVYPSFILGKCRCGYCDEDIPVARGRYGDLRRFAYGHNARGVNNPKYRGTGVTNHNYEWMNMPWHPNAGKDGRVYKHVWMMSRKLGRPLEKGEVVHHIDGNPRNNSFENIQLMSTQGLHRTEHRIDKSNWNCSTCGGKTYTDENGYEAWYDDGNGGHTCKKCYERIKYQNLKNKK